MAHLADILGNCNISSLPKSRNLIKKSTSKDTIVATTYRKGHDEYASLNFARRTGTMSSFWGRLQHIEPVRHAAEGCKPPAFCMRKKFDSTVHAHHVDESRCTKRIFVITGTMHDQSDESEFLIPIYR